MAAAPPANPDHTIHENAVVCSESELHGKVVVGKGSIIHPACVISANVGRIVIGESCVLEEQVIIINNAPEDFVIGDFNLFEVGAQLAGRSTIGQANVFESKTYVPEGSTIGSGCTIGLGVVLPPQSQVPDETVIYGSEMGEAKQEGGAMLNKQAIEKVTALLQETLPKCHYLKK